MALSNERFALNFLEFDSTILHMRFHRGRVYFVRWDRNPACQSREVAQSLPGARRINNTWYTPVSPYKSGDTSVDNNVPCKCDAFCEESRFLLPSHDLIPADLLYDVAQGQTPLFFRSLPDSVETGC